MPILQLVLTLIVVGVLLWAMETYIPMNVTIKRIIQFVVILCVLWWVLGVFGLTGYLGNVQTPTVGGRR